MKQLYGDGLEHFFKRILDNPDVKFVLSNFIHETLIKSYDLVYCKEVFIKYETLLKSWCIESLI